jgi:hypothetical protein
MAALEEKTNGWPLASNGAFPHGEPSKLARDEAEARITLRLHHQHMVIAWFLAHLCDTVRAAGNALCFKQILNQLSVLRIVFDR